MTTTSRDVSRRSSGTLGGAEPSQARSLSSAGEWLRSPVAPYYLVLISGGALASIGLVMVLSASTVEQYWETGSSYGLFVKQLMFLSIGLVLAWVASRISIPWWKRLAVPGLVLAVGLQALVFTPLGFEVQGNRNWIRLGGTSLQPSEFAKIAVVVFGATILANRRKQMHRIGYAMMPFMLPGVLTVVALVVAGRDLGTAMVLLAIAAGMLFVAGLPLRWFGLLGGFAAVGVAYLALTSGNRMQRINAWLGDICSSPQVEGCFQKVHAEYALADGGWWGLGPGASREKWSLLPEPHNDFIMAIIGEELGLPGTFLVLALFSLLAYACFRIISSTKDTFARLATAGVMVWIVAQAMLNVGSVIGMLPIIGVPLPLVSSGGTALISALMGLGLLLGMARSVPGCRAALAGRPSTLRRTFAALPGRRSPS